MGRDTRNALLVMFALMLMAAAPWQWPKTAVVDDTGTIRGGLVPLTVGAAPLTYTSPTSGTAGTSSGVLITAGAFTRVVTVQTLPASTCNTWLQPSGAAAVVGTGALVAAGGGAYTFGTVAAPMPAGNITAITDCGSPQTVTLVGG